MDVFERAVFFRHMIDRRESLTVGRIEYDDAERERQKCTTKNNIKMFHDIAPF